MVSSVVFSVLASAMLIQAAYAQIGCGCGVNNYAPVVSSCGNNLNNLGYNNLLGSNLIGLNNGYGSVLSNGIAYPESLLSIASGSYTTPNGISVVAENLEIGGTVSVSGAMPFVGAVSMGGVAPTTGQATVAYNSVPGVALTDAGCGQGISGVGPNVGYNGLVGNNYIGNGLIGNNLVGNRLIGNNLGYSVGGCGCL
ncbi:hypothetical protein JYU34_019871 [Plutella xylostella]|uniref:Uncharacterized protein n=1 Tax=Plutella xylostella TaxID=51655 RepID=A0ABQ7PWU0_PLUXY|nr:uncharacterized protein LOC105392213 [Plutella xylostella]KAG7296959.1 hypothetical protein JYU34_019871 [Plutella xylostella]